MATCPDCNGSGQYVGFSTVEDCRTCGGSGQAKVQPWAPTARLKSLMHDLAIARRNGSVSSADQYLNALIRLFVKDPSLLPPGVDLDCVLNCLGDEVQRVWDISLAPTYNRSRLMLNGWDGTCCGLNLETP
jgi:hypothetical protein